MLEVEHSHLSSHPGSQPVQSWLVFTDALLYSDDNYIELFSIYID